MTIHRERKSGNFTTLSNELLQDRRLSLKARGLLGLMLSLPDSWSFNVRGLATLCREGTDAVRSALRELEAAGYVRRRQPCGPGGQFAHSAYEVFEKPTTENPATDNPTTENPATENPALIKTPNKKKEEKKEHSKKSPSIYPPDGDEDEDGDRQLQDLLEDMRENLEIELLREGQESRDARRLELAELALEAAATRAPALRIAGAERPMAEVRERLGKLDLFHLDYIIDAMDSHPTEIRNIRAYLLAALFNAPVTQEGYYSAMLARDEKERLERAGAQPARKGARAPAVYEYDEKYV